MSLSKKYGINESVIKAMISDGWLSCTVSKYEEVYFTYKKEIERGIPKLQAIHNAAEVGKISERQVYTIIHRFE